MNVNELREMIARRDDEIRHRAKRDDEGKGGAYRYAAKLEHTPRKYPRYGKVLKTSGRIRTMHEASLDVSSVRERVPANGTRRTMPYVRWQQFLPDPLPRMSYVRYEALDLVTDCDDNGATLDLALYDVWIRERGSDKWHHVGTIDYGNMTQYEIRTCVTRWRDAINGTPKYRERMIARWNAMPRADKRRLTKLWHTLDLGALANDARVIHTVRRRLAPIVKPDFSASEFYGQILPDACDDVASDALLQWQEIITRYNWHTMPAGFHYLLLRQSISRASYNYCLAKRRLRIREMHGTGNVHYDEASSNDASYAGSELRDAIASRLTTRQNIVFDAICSGMDPEMIQREASCGERTYYNELKAIRGIANALQS